MLYSAVHVLILCLAEQCLDLAGLQNDCPFSSGGNGQSQLSVDDAEQVPAADFKEYASRLNTYLQVLSCCTTCLLHDCVAMASASHRWIIVLGSFPV